MNTPPEEFNYVVSHDGDEMDMRVPSQLFPDHNRAISPMAKEVIQRSNSLTEAASKAMVKKKSHDDDMKEDQSSKSKKSKKPKTKQSTSPCPKISKLIALYVL